LIKHLKNTEINFIRWDNCINKAINGNVFAYSWYLNILCDNWEALVMDDYQYVMPLLHEVKFKQDVYIHSKLGNRLGVFSNQLLTEEIVKKFIESIPHERSLIHISLNSFNKLTSGKVKNIKTYELDLIQSHKRIAQKYSNQFQKDLQKAKEDNISVVQGLLPNDLINFSNIYTVRSNPKLNLNEIQKLRMIIAHSLRFGLSETYCAYSANNNLCAAAFFIKSKRNIYLLYAAISNIGLNSNAFHLLIDKYIEVHSEKDLTLTLDNIISKNNMDFFSGVGAHEYKFQQYYSNSLSWIYNLLLKNS
jgi:hypothetical protein